MGVLDFVICLLVLIVGYNLKNNYKDLTFNDKKLLNKIFYFHFFMGVVFYLYITNFGGDALYYWRAPKEIDFNYLLDSILEKSSPNKIVYLVNYFPSNTLGLDFFTGNMLYCFFGYWSYIYFILTLRAINPLYERLGEIKILGYSLVPMIFFLPNLHFWSSGLGKDTLLFFAISMFVYSIMKLKGRIHLLISSFLISFLFRPHITLFMVAAFGFSSILNSKIHPVRKTLLMVIILIIFIPLLNSVLEFAKIDNLESDSIQDFAETKAGFLTKAGSGVDMSNYPLIIKIITFLYRPLFFDINNMLAIIASVENLFYVILTVKLLKSQPVLMFKRCNYIVKGSFYFFVIGAIALSQIMSNFGIMIREKNMLLLPFCLFALSIFYQRTVVPKLQAKNNVL